MHGSHLGTDDEKLLDAGSRIKWLAFDAVTAPSVFGLDRHTRGEPPALAGKVLMGRGPASALGDGPLAHRFPAQTTRRLNGPQARLLSPR